MEEVKEEHNGVMPTREEFVALLNRVFDISTSSSAPDDEGGESIPLESSRAKLKRMKSLKMADMHSKMTVGNKRNLKAFLQDESSSAQEDFTSPESLQSADNKLTALFGENFVELLFEESKSPGKEGSKDDKSKRPRGRSMLRMASTLRKDQKGPSPQPGSSPTQQSPLSQSSPAPFNINIPQPCRSTPEERSAARAKLCKCLQMGEKEMIEALRATPDAPVLTSPKKKSSTATFGSSKTMPKHRRSTSAGAKEELVRKTITKKPKNEDEIDAKAQEFDSQCAELGNLFKIKSAFGKNGTIEVIKALSDIFLESDKRRYNHNFFSSL